MTATAVYTWAAASTTAVCLAQTTAGAGSLPLNGTLVSGALIPTATFTGTSRTVSLTSAGDHHLQNFTITGTYNSNTYTEVIAGPNANTVYTVGLFDSVTSVSVSAAILVTGVSIGTGTTGHTTWFSVDPYRVPIALTAQVVVSGGAGNITYYFRSTLDDVQASNNTNIGNITLSDGIVMPQAANVDAFQLLMHAAQTTQIATYTYPCLYATINVTASTADGALVSTFLQQGVK